MMSLKHINVRIFYNDTFSVLRLVNTEAEDHSITQSLMPVSGLQNVPCRVSKATQDAAAVGSAIVNPVSVDLMLFTHPEYTIKAGDTVEIVGKRYFAGEPYVCDWFQQINLSRVGEA